MFHQSETPTQVINWVPVIQNVCDWEAFLGQWWPSQQGEVPGRAVEGVSRAAGRATPPPTAGSVAPQVHGVVALVPSPALSMG